MPWITTILLGVVLLLQYPLWLGKGSLPHLQQVEQSLQAQKQKNAELKLRNTAMEAEIQDLKRGYDAIEERARSELGMVKPKEILYEYLTPPNDRTVIVNPHDNPKPKALKPKPKTSLPPVKKLLDQQQELVHDAQPEENSKNKALNKEADAPIEKD